MTPIKGIVLGSLATLIIRSMVAVLVATTSIPFASPTWFLLHLPLTTLGHLVGGYIAGYFWPKNEIVGALASAALTCLSLMLFLLIPSVRYELLVVYGR